MSATPADTTGFVADTITFSNVDGPGNRFVVFLQGCNFDCVACHNPQTIPLATGEHFRTSVAELLPRIRRAAPFLGGITVSGGEATLQPDFVHALFSTVKADPDMVEIAARIIAQKEADFDPSAFKDRYDDALRDLIKAEADWSILILRYFNPIGAHPSGAHVTSHSSFKTP